MAGLTGMPEFNPRRWFEPGCHNRAAPCVYSSQWACVYSSQWETPHSVVCKKNRTFRVRRNHRFNAMIVFHCLAPPKLNSLHFIPQFWTSLSLRWIFVRWYFLCSILSCGVRWIERWRDFPRWALLESATNLDFMRQQRSSDDFPSSALEIGLRLGLCRQTESSCRTIVSWVLLPVFTVGFWWSSLLLGSAIGCRNLRSEDRLVKQYCAQAEDPCQSCVIWFGKVYTFSLYTSLTSQVT